MYWKIHLSSLACLLMRGFPLLRGPLLRGSSVLIFCLLSYTRYLESVRSLPYIFVHWCSRLQNSFFFAFYNWIHPLTLPFYVKFACLLTIQARHINIALMNHCKKTLLPLVMYIRQGFCSHFCKLVNLFRMDTCCICPIFLMCWDGCRKGSRKALEA